MTGLNKPRFHRCQNGIHSVFRMGNVLFLILLIFPLYAFAQCKNPLPGEWGGHLRLRGAVSFPETNSLLDMAHHDRLHDGAFEFRLKNSTMINDKVDFECHYEMIGSGGETRKTLQSFLDRYPDLSDSLLPGETINDARRVMDLTREISSHTEYLVYHRIDRLVFSAYADRGSVRIGRQALTWGNGFLFNPMDLFNPFSPTDVERDYKIGDDMITAQIYTGGAGEFQMLYVPRRNTDNHDIEWEESSVAAKYHFNISTTDVDLMAGKNYEDTVFGVGFTGYVSDAAWRLDGTWTWLDDQAHESGFASIAANIDYSWVWFEKNLYAWIEYYYTGLGKQDVSDALTDMDIVERVGRGERFTFGRSYVDAQIQVEWHPLVNSFMTIIYNTRDGSGIMQPRVSWDLLQNLQVMGGATIYHGESGTEFGGVELPGTGTKEIPADGAYVWLSYFF